MSIGNMDTVLTHTISFLGVAMIVAIIVRRMRLPYTVGLILAGQGLAVAGVEIMLTHDFIFQVILPPLLFEAALSIRWRERIWRSCLFSRRAGAHHAFAHAEAEVL